jgi:hypothetical protein
MTILAGILMPLLLAIAAGKHTRYVRFSAYVGIVVLALVQLCLVLIEVFTMLPPSQ